MIGRGPPRSTRHMYCYARGGRTVRGAKAPDPVDVCETLSLTHLRMVPPLHRHADRPPQQLVPVRLGAPLAHQQRVNLRGAETEGQWVNTQRPVTHVELGGTTAIISQLCYRLRVRFLSIKKHNINKERFKDNPLICLYIY